MQTFSFVFVLLCLAEPYVRSVCCHTEVCSAEIKLQVSNAPFPFKKKNKMMFSFFIHLSIIRKGNLSICLKLLDPQLTGLSVSHARHLHSANMAGEPVRCPHQIRDVHAQNTNQIRLNKNKNWNSLKTAFYNHLVIIETDITVNQSHYC